MQRIVAIIQARMTSTRLPGKVLRDLAGKTMLERVVERTRRATSLSDVVVATTTEAEETPIVELATLKGWRFSRGSRDDVLDRYYNAAREHGADVVARITSDCPLIDPEVIDQVVGCFLEGGSGVDYVSNTYGRRTFPRGLDVEVFGFETLERAWREDKDPAWREHVTPYVYRHPELFACRVVEQERDLSHLRWTVDTPEDLQFAKNVYDALGGDVFGMDDVLALLEEHPEWIAINADVKQKTVK